MKLRCELECNIGCVRQSNQDIILLNGAFYRDQSHKEAFEVSVQSRFCAIIADGMGGHAGGELASKIATQSFDSFLMELPQGLSDKELTLQTENWTRQTHLHILAEGTAHPLYANMGTTLTGIFGYEGKILLINIGDSRVYRFRDSIFKQLSRDHSIRELTRDDHCPTNQIYNSLGAGEEVFAELKDLSGQLLKEDCFLICSDGLTDMLADDEISRLLENGASAGELVEAARQAGGNDNISVLLMWVVEEESIEESEEEGFDNSYEENQNPNHPPRLSESNSFSKD